MICSQCGERKDCIYLDDQGYTCAECLFGLVDRGALEFSPYCSYCGDNQAYICESCYENGIEENTTGCYECGDTDLEIVYCSYHASRARECTYCGEPNDELHCFECARADWGLVDASEAVVVPPIMAMVSDSGEISLDGMAVRWD
jgi:hypothetical protein